MWYIPSGVGLVTVCSLRAVLDLNVATEGRILRIGVRVDHRIATLWDNTTIVNEHGSQISL